MLHYQYNTFDYSYEHLLYEGNVLRHLSEVDVGHLGKLDKHRITHIKNVYYLMTENYNNGKPAQKK